MLVFECPSCKTKLQVADEHAGKTIACPKCQTKATVPTPVEPEVEVAIVEPDAVPVQPKANVRSNEPDDNVDDDNYGDEPEEARPRRKRKPITDTGAAKAAAGIGGMSIASILLIAGGVLSLLRLPGVPISGRRQGARGRGARNRPTISNKSAWRRKRSTTSTNACPFNGSDQQPLAGPR